MHSIALRISFTMMCLDTSLVLFTSYCRDQHCTTRIVSDIVCLCVGHLKRFMRGIAELVEVSKSAPPTPSPIPRLQHDVNGHATPTSNGTVPSFPEDNKTPEPQDDDVTIIAPPVGFDATDMMNQISNNLQPPVSAKPKRFSQDEAILTSDPSRPRAYSGEREGSVPSDGGGGYNRMRQLLEQQMGSSRSTESLEMSVGSESSDIAKNNSRSPSHSPRIARKPHKVHTLCVCVYFTD